MSRKAHIPLKPPQYWVDAVKEWRRNQTPKMSLAEFGERAAAAIGEKRPYSHATMSRVLAGNTTEQVANAVAVLTGIPLPEKHDLPADEAHWLELGKRLKAIDERLFIDESFGVRELVEALERRHRDRHSRKRENE